MTRFLLVLWLLATLSGVAVTGMGIAAKDPWSATVMIVCGILMFSISLLLLLELRR